MKFQITENSTPLTAGERIQCKTRAEGGHCQQTHKHTGTVLIADTGSKYVIVKYDDRKFDEAVRRDSLKREVTE